MFCVFGVGEVVFDEQCLEDDHGFRTGAFYPDYTMASSSSICRSLSSGGDMCGLLGKVCKCANNSDGSVEDRTERVVNRLFLDCAREMDARAHTGVFLDIPPGLATTEVIVHAAQETIRRLLFVILFFTSCCSNSHGCFLFFFCALLGSMG